MNLFNTRKELNLPDFANIVLKRWKENETFKKHGLKKRWFFFCFL